MSIHYDPSRRTRPYVVRWREQGRQRTRRFALEREALAFQATLETSTPSAGTPAEELAALRAQLAQLEARLDGPGPEAPPAVGGRSGEGVYAYETKAGTRYRFVFRHADGRMSGRRGFPTRAAARRAKRELEESVRRGEIKAARDAFAKFWARALAERKPYLAPGSYLDYETHGRKRLLPAFGGLRVSAIDEDRVRAWLADQAAQVEAGEIAPKTVNNARTCLAVVLNEAVARGLLARNPCDRVKPLPEREVERDYLRMSEIEPYLDACAEHYRPLAEFLIGTGARVSEALAVRWDDLELDRHAVRIYRQRDRSGAGTAATKGKRFRAVQIGPRVTETLRRCAHHQQRHGTQSLGWVFLCPTPSRGRYARRHLLAPPHRKTVHDWHEQALADAGLRDMALHCLRHTAAAAWLASNHPLIFVQRQLGHRSITTTEAHYGHLEAFFLRDAAAKTEAVIAAATRLVPEQRAA